MTKGKNLIEMLKFSSDIAHRKVIDLGAGKKIYRFDPQRQWFTETIVEEDGSTERELPTDAEIPLSGWTETGEERLTLTNVDRNSLKIPYLRKKIKVGRWSVKFTNPGKPVIKSRPEPEHILWERPDRESEQAEAHSERHIAETRPRTESRRGSQADAGPRFSRLEKHSARPVKVIRRRGAEAPKVIQAERAGED
jgi:hypothetical protein